MAPSPDVKVPGDRLGLASELAVGPGTYARGPFVYASTTGAMAVTPGEPVSVHLASPHRLICPAFFPDACSRSTRFPPPIPPHLIPLPTVSVRRAGAQTAIPSVGAIVIAKVARVTPRAAMADIVCVGAHAVTDKFSGIVRQQDVRATEIDKVDLLASYRPGDLIRAQVLSLGDSRAYFLSTAKNDLGVILAKGVAGVPMMPISWQEMRCPITDQVENRKVAKVT
ncbi:unnamed protein product [Closterium sp. Naga37s-1]|nr:unnamed protein product [Closterium sp. Naga37s-1]